jgi:hypothetical protein
LVGVTAVRLATGEVTSKEQLSLFPPRPDPRRDLARTVDKIRERFGGDAITRASLLEPAASRKRGKVKGKR